MTCHLSLVIPHYNEEDRLNLMEEGLVEFVKEIKDLKVEAILVDDGSHDKTLSGLKRIGKDFLEGKITQVKARHFSVALPRHMGV